MTKNGNSSKAFVMEKFKSVLLLLMLIPSLFSSVNSVKTSDAECLIIDPFSRENCGNPGITQGSCELIIDPASGRPCCYDDTILDVPWCYVSAEDLNLLSPTIVPTSATSTTSTTSYPPVSISRPVYATNESGYFRPTPDVIGNIVPTGTFASDLLNKQGSASSSSQDLETLLQSLGIQQVAPAGEAVSNPVSDSDKLVEDGADANRTVKLCTYIKNNQIQPQIADYFEDTIRQCDSIAVTVSPAIAKETLREEIDKIIASYGNQVPTANVPSNEINSLGNTPSAVDGGSSNNLLNTINGGSASNLINALGGRNNNKFLQNILGGGTSSVLLNALGGTNYPSSILKVPGAGSSDTSILSSLLKGDSSTSTIKLLRSLLGDGNGLINAFSNKNLLATLLNSQTLSPIKSKHGAIGAQLPDFIGSSSTPVYNPLICKLLLRNVGSSMNSGSYSSILRANLFKENGCLENILNNPLFILSGGSEIDNIRDTLGPLLGLTSSTDEQDSTDTATGPLDPALIPIHVLADCLNQRDNYNRLYNCKVGIHINIQTEQECLNIGCVHASGRMCFKCPLIKSSAQVNQLPIETCNVLKKDRIDCQGFNSFFLLNTLLSRRDAPLLIHNNVNNLDSYGSIISKAISGRAGFENLAGLVGLDSLSSGGHGGLISDGSDYNDILLQKNCESRGCCWDASNNLFDTQGVCFQKALPKISGSSIDCTDSLTCGKSSAGILARIIGGTPATSQSDRPWQIIIRRTKSNDILCTGVILCSQWILTTASCLVKIQSVTSPLGLVLDISPTLLEVIFETIDSNSPFTTGQKAPVSSIVPHPYYQVTQFYHDVALVQVTSLVFRTNIQPICLPSFASSNPVSGKILFVAGYGQASSVLTQTTLKEIKVITITNDACKKFYKTSLPMSGVFCATAATAGEDTCTGDGGSPALSFDTKTNTFTVLGINFAGSDDCSGSKPMVFVDIPAYREWIRETTNGCCSMLGARSEQRATDY